MSDMSHIRSGNRAKGPFEKGLTILVFFFRELPGGNHMLEGKTELTLRQASRTIAYKYVVVPNTARTAKDKPTKDLWECLIDFRPVIVGKHVNRCLRIPESSIKANGKHNGNHSTPTSLCGTASCKVALVNLDQYCLYDHS